MKLGILMGLGLVAVGGAAYAHKRRGGTLTVDSLKESLELAKSVVQGRLNQAKDAVQSVVSTAQPSAAPPAGERFGYSEYSVAKTDRDIH